LPFRIAILSVCLSPGKAHAPRDIAPSVFGRNTDAFRILGSDHQVVKLSHCHFIGRRALLRAFYRVTLATSDPPQGKSTSRAEAEIAADFDDLIEGLLQTRRDADARREDDITTSLMHDLVWDRPLTSREIGSILRNWTVGEIGTISASLGICVHYLATHPDLQDQLRCTPSLLPTASRAAFARAGIQRHAVLPRREVVERRLDFAGYAFGHLAHPLVRGFQASCAIR
jgi:cytochrome P450